MAANAAENPRDQSHDRIVRAGLMTLKNASVGECEVVLKNPKNHEDFILHLGFMVGFPPGPKTSLICPFYSRFLKEF